MQNEVGEISFVECVVLEWHNQHYLLPLALMEEALVLDAKQMMSGQYRWRDNEISLMTLDGKQIEGDIVGDNIAGKDISPNLNPPPRLKIAVLHMKSDVMPYMGLLFEKEAKQVAVRSSELTWEDASRSLAILNQPRLTQAVIIFQSKILQAQT